MPEAIRDRYQYFTEARMDRIRAAGFELEEIDSRAIDADTRHFYALDDRLFRARKPLGTATQ